MTRRQAIRNGVLMAVAMALGKMDLLKAQGGQLTVPLDQWREIVFIRKGKRVTIGVDEVFWALSEMGQ